MNSDGIRKISVNALARVEGEGSLRVRVADGRVEIAEFSIFEPPGSSRSFSRDVRSTRCPIWWLGSAASVRWPIR